MQTNDKEPYKMEPHNFNMRLRGSAYIYCGKCGLIMMRNDFSQWFQKMGCNAADHPSYASQRAKTSPFK